MPPKVWPYHKSFPMKSRQWFLDNGLTRKSTLEEVYTKQRQLQDEYMYLNYLRREKIRIAKRMAYEKLFNELGNKEVIDRLLKKDDKHVELVLKQFGIEIVEGETIRV